jgi:hypothetical protein
MLQIVIYLGLLRWACDGELLHLVRDSFHYPTSVGVSLVTAADHGIRMHSRFCGTCKPCQWPRGELSYPE